MSQSGLGDWVGREHGGRGGHASRTVVQQSAWELYGYGIIITRR